MLCCNSLDAYGYVVITIGQQFRCNSLDACGMMSS